MFANVSKCARSANNLARKTALTLKFALKKPLGLPSYARLAGIDVHGGPQECKTATIFLKKAI
jgi:hypothetical protein